MSQVHQLARRLRKLKPFRMRVVTRLGCVPSGEIHWTEPPLIEIRKGSRFGECNALLHEFAHLYTDQQKHNQKFRWGLLELVEEYGDLKSYP